MTSDDRSNLIFLLAAVLGESEARDALATLTIDDALAGESGPRVSRAVLAMVLNVALFADLVRRVPTAAAYVAEQRARSQPICFDHGALRTIRFADGPTGALPAGIAAIARVLEPLGYARAATYPLPALKMTGFAFTQADRPEAIPQFFVSELHVDAFDAAFEAAAHAVFDASRDPLDAAALEALAAIGREGALDRDRAVAVLPVLVRCFDRQHGEVRLADYEALLAQSAEAAWISTEGQAFNHATDRVADVEALAERLRAEGKPIKDRIEVSSTGRVRQTAFRADSVTRTFIDADGEDVAKIVPGSFYEFITRDVDPASGRLDLGFDSGNATGIFAMTRPA